MSFMKQLSKVVVVVGFAALMGTGCRAADAALDCHSICQRYHDCFDTSYGVQSCEERCRDNANNSTAYYTKVDTCDACIDDKACTSTVFSCGVNCSSVVP